MQQGGAADAKIAHVPVCPQQDGQLRGIGIGLAIGNAITKVMLSPTQATRTGDARAPANETSESNPANHLKRTVGESFRFIVDLRL